MLAGSCPVIKYYALPHLVLKKIRNVLSKHHFVNSPVVSHIDAFPSIGVRLTERKEKSLRCIWRWTLSNPISVVFYWRDISVTKGKLWIFCKSTITMDSPVCQGAHLTERNEKIMYYSWRSTQLCAAVRSEWTHPNPKVLAIPESGPIQIQVYESRMNIYDQIYRLWLEIIKKLSNR